MHFFITVTALALLLAPAVLAQSSQPDAKCQAANMDFLTSVLPCLDTTSSTITQQQKDCLCTSAVRSKADAVFDACPTDARPSNSGNTPSNKAGYDCLCSSTVEEINSGAAARKPGCAPAAGSPPAQASVTLPGRASATLPTASSTSAPAASAAGPTSAAATPAAGATPAATGGSSAGKVAVQWGLGLGAVVVALGM
ncbi:hypothetical protein HK097_010938 [Rhizophlyctis rosea]|uniref:Uncharacterized protein n=1 Tax=Rhizophlyctis rosea TaxID=64517 RepID=A0AAD5S9N7_9FUNG|nr:hypothetical protein HK097_010938 [Rhizophlyctis rosea]